MRRNSVYIAFILGGAMVGERVSVWWREEERAKPPLINPGAPTLSPRLLCPHTPRPAPFLPSSPQAVDYAINSAWKSNNKGKLYEDCVAAGTIGGATGEEE